MEEFVSEHGGVLVSGLISVFLIILILGVIVAVSNLDEYMLMSIIGD